MKRRLTPKPMNATMLPSEYEEPARSVSICIAQGHQELTPTLHIRKKVVPEKVHLLHRP
jgi:hypothetical protein